MPTIRIFSRRVAVPGNRLARAAIGGGFILGGSLGFLPVLGFWMIPAGLLVLSIDSARVRHLNRRMTVRIVRAWNGFRGKPEPPSPEAN